MKILTGSEEREALSYIDLAAVVALDAECERSKCGSIIVSLDEIIGEGFNSPAGEVRRCSNSKKDYDIKVTDKTCCVHAEQRAIMDALRRNPSKIKGSRLYFIRLKDDKISLSGEPYCTICSKMALDVGVSEFVLFKLEGVCVYSCEEYNDLSFRYGKD